MTLTTLFSSDTATFVETYRKLDFSNQLFVWIEMQRRILAGDTGTFIKYLMPLLSPIINSFKNRLKPYGTYREDFAQEAQIAVYEHMADYNPYYKGAAVLGTVYFKNCIQTAFTNTCRQHNRDCRSFGCDDFDYVLQANDKGMDDTLAEDYVMQSVAQVYDEMQNRYSSEQYAKLQTRKWAKAQRIGFYDIFS